VVKAICQTARRKGVRIHQNTPVRQLTTAKGRLAAAVTDDSVFEGEVFVNAAGAWSQGLCNLIDLDFPLTFINDHTIVTEPLPMMITQFIASDRFYFRQALEGNFHIGGDVAWREVTKFEKDVDFSTFIELGRRVAVYLPSLRNVRVMRAWGGIIHSTPDKIPILDRVAGFENFFIAAGFSGHGFALGPIVGKLMAELIVDKKSSLDLSAFRWGRFDSSNNANK
jgi:sarcosine oxidase subunit beta